MCEQYEETSSEEVKCCHDARTGGGREYAFQAEGRSHANRGMDAEDAAEQLSIFFDFIEEKIC